ncbi:hypothetical protein LTR62_004899 [Meristemomyces frigidus]|uniref:DUF221-domain-containing protein n=1 Tax=Meristemomyces frigidus TaxID=1508187 RepID=A0AAN7TFR2_9PEZI|nr:hypothetical protein LTR62_004899 [Meristemomyces frigidus]
MSSPSQPTCTPGQHWYDAIDCGAGAALNSTGVSINALLAAIAAGAVAFAVQLAIFLLLRLRLSRIYRPRSYLVPERERVAPPPAGIIRWLYPLFTTPNLAFIQKCGLDAYFFLRYLRMLLKFFVPVAVVVLPIMLPLNRYSGPTKNVHGLDLLSISNINPEHMGHRLWAHLIMAIGVTVWFCYLVYKELRGYIRVRQAYLTSPQHRIRASATTVLVTGIPRKWLTLEALNGLYDVFPGGIRNIWINRNFDELSGKVHLRDTYAKQLEGAETDLIKKCRKAHEKKAEEKRKKEGGKKSSKQELKEKRDAEDAAAEQLAHTEGTSAGDQHTTHHGLQDILHDEVNREVKEQEKQMAQHKKRPFGGFMGDGLDKLGLGAVNEGLSVAGHGIGAFGKNVGMFGQKFVGDVDAGFRNVGRDFDNATSAVNDGQGFVTDDELYRQSMLSMSDHAPTPPMKTPAVEREARLQDARAARENRRTVDQRGPIHASGDAAGDALENKQHPLATLTRGANDPSQPSPSSDDGPGMKVVRPSVESKTLSQMEIYDPAALEPRTLGWKLWKNNDKSLAMPSPQPHTADEDEFPLNADVVRTGPDAPKGGHDVSASKLAEQFMFWKKDKDAPKEVYATAFDDKQDEDQDEQPRWRHFIEPKDRDTLRMPLIDQSWFPSLPFVGAKKDKIYWLRRELARLNLEIETDQNDVEKFPYMNSAFIQFNHQVAAHMACQSLSHHVPQQMAPRLLEISPDDVLWDNMSIKWWERYIRTGFVLIVCAGLIILYAVPVTFTSLLAHLNTLAASYTWMAWAANLPNVAKSIIQGVLPPVLLSLILLLVPVIFRALVKQQGVATGNQKELGVQTWYFAFLFIQVFFVVTISSGLTQFFQQLGTQPGQVVKSLSESLPKAADYFFQYLLLQGLSNSASALLQLWTLFAWFILAALMDSTPRQKWSRQTSLSNIQWGSFFPPFTNFAVIGIIYSVIAPFILIFMIIIFGLFWVVYRYNVLYVYQFRNDTGGLLFPTAVNQLFVGIYFMEIALAGYFFIAQGPTGKVVAIPQGAVMVVACIFTILYQWQLNKTFSPLFQFLPITLEDEAVIRDEAFAKMQANRFAPEHDSLVQREATRDDERDIEDVLEDREIAEQHTDQVLEQRDAETAGQHRRSSHTDKTAERAVTPQTAKNDWAHRRSPRNAPASPTWKTDRWRTAAPDAVRSVRNLASREHEKKPTTKTTDRQQSNQDPEAQHTVGDVLFSGFADELEDLTPDERDILVRYAFQHSALRSKRPVVWIPRDRLGVSDDEIKRAKKMSTVFVPGGEDDKASLVEKTNIWMSNEGTALDGKGKVVFRRSPPDFSSVDLIAL